MQINWGECAAELFVIYWLILLASEKPGGWHAFTWRMRLRWYLSKRFRWFCREWWVECDLCGITIASFVHKGEYSCKYCHAILYPSQHVNPQFADSPAPKPNREWHD